VNLADPSESDSRAAYSRLNFEVHHLVPGRGHKRGSSVARPALMPSAKGSAVETFSLDTPLGELLCDRINVLQANCEVSFAT
jgi:hypothetical protein